MTEGGVAVFPAIDLRHGRCVRLEQGLPERATVYDTAPREVLHSFEVAGAEWVHVVDLDAAFGEGSNRDLLAELIGATKVRVQTGGGIRSLGAANGLLEAGAARVVIGTAALEDPEMVRAAVERWGAARVAVGIDARGTRPAARGWREETDADLFALGERMVGLGVRTLVYTDIERDGMLGGPNLAGSLELARRTGAEVIVSGGVRGSTDIRAVADAARGGAGLAGVIVGKALYGGRVTPAEAVAAAR